MLSAISDRIVRCARRVALRAEQDGKPAVDFATTNVRRSGQHAHRHRLVGSARYPGRRRSTRAVRRWVDRDAGARGRSGARNASRDARRAGARQRKVPSSVRMRRHTTLALRHWTVTRFSPRVYEVLIAEIVLPDEGGARNRAPPDHPYRRTVRRPLMDSRYDGRRTGTRVDGWRRRTDACRDETSVGHGRTAGTDIGRRRRWSPEMPAKPPPTCNDGPPEVMSN